MRFKISSGGENGLKINNIKIESILCICAVIFTFLPTGLLDQIGVPELYVNLLECASLVIYSIYILVHTKRLAYNRTIVFALLVLVIEVLTTMLRGGHILKAFFETYKMCCILIILYNEFYHLKKDIKKYITLMCVAYGLLSGIFSLLNPFTISIFGIRTEISNYIIPIVAIIFMEFEEMPIWTKIISVITILLSIISVYFYVDVSTAKVTLFLIIFMCIFDKFIKRVRIDFLIFTFAVLFFGIVVFRINEHLGFLIEDVLKESINLHNRTIAWDYTFDLIAKSPLLGYGYIGQEYQYSILYKVTQGWFSHPHNEFLRLYLIGGVLNIVAILGMFVSTARTLKKFYDNKKIRIITYTLFTMLIMSIDETCFNSFFYVVLAMGISAEYIVLMDQQDSLKT